MDIDLFNFDLPKTLIAQESIFPPDLSKLLIIEGSNLQDSLTRNLSNILDKGDIVVVNNTKVIKSNILGCHNSKNYLFTFLNEQSPNIWKALTKGSKKLIINDKIEFNGGMTGIIINKNDIGEIFIKIEYIKSEFIKYLNIYGQNGYNQKT